MKLSDYAKAWAEGIFWAAVSGVVTGAYTSYFVQGGLDWKAVGGAAIGGIFLYLRQNKHVTAAVACPTCGETPGK